MKLLEIPIYRPVTTGMFLVCLTVLGIVGIYLLPLDFFPMVKEPEIDVNVPFPGSHPLEALEEVARPLEEEIATISGLKRMETDIRNSNVEVEAMFSWSSDVDLKRMEVREAVERARSRLPDRIGHILVEGDTDGPSGGSILQGRISAERDLSESWALLDQHIRRPLERVPGVARVDLYGVEPQQVRVDLDLARLQEHGIDAGELARRIDSENQDVDVGVIRGDSIRYELRTVGRFRSVDEMRELSIGAGDLRLGDVADVSMGEPRLDYGRHLNRKFAIGIDVYKEPSANTVETVDRVLVEIEHIQTDPRLEGVILLVWENAAKEIRGSLSSLRNAGMFGGCLAIVVLFFFLKRIGSTLIVGTAIPFSLVVTCGVMYLFDMPFDVLSMLGLMLGVGMLVDNAVVVMENIHRHRAMGKSPQEAALTGVREVGLAVLASTATTVIVWSWLFTAERSPMTIYIGVVAAVICFSVGCSLLISLTFIPMMTARFGVGQAPAPGFILRRVIPGYRQLLGWTLRHRFVTLVLLVILASSAAFPLAMLEKTGEPKNIQTSVPIIYEVFDASTKKTLERHVNQVEAWVWERRDELQIENMYTFYSEPKRVITSLYLAEGRSGEKELEVLREKLEENLPVLAGVRLRVGDGNFGSGMNLGRRLVFLALHGEDPEYLQEIAEEVESTLRTIPDAREVFGPSIEGQPELRLRIRSDQATRYGITPKMVANAVTFAFRGIHLNRYHAAHGEVEVVLGLPEDERPGIASLEQLFLKGNSGEPVPLGSVATIDIGRIPQGIHRTDRSTTTHISVEFDKEEYTTAQAQEIVTDSLAGLTLPDGYSWDWGQFGRRQDDSLQTMVRGVTLSLIVVLLLMAALFESLTQPLAIIITLPLAFFGAFWALWLFGYSLDIVAFIGIIILIGTVVNNGIVMVDHVNGLRSRGVRRVDALVEGCGDRLRPVVMTAITTIFGLIPLARSGATVAGVYVDGIAVAMIGGLTTSTIFTLLALPVWYTYIEDVGAIALRLLFGNRREPLPAETEPAGS